MTNQPTSVTTGRVRLSYVNVFQPREDMSGRKKYSVTLLIPKTDTATVQRINDAIEAAKKKGLDGVWGGAMPPQCPVPIHDGDGVRDNGEAYGEECRGHWVMTASANENHPPQVVDGMLNKILDQTALYSGCYAHVNINFYPYGGGNTGFKKGIGCGLGPIQKVADGDPLGGSAPAPESVFSKIPNAVASGAGTEVSGEANPFGVTAMQPNINPLTGQPM